MTALHDERTTGTQLRVAQRDLKTLQRQHQKTLEQWTRERGELRTRLRQSRRRERLLVQLLTDYLAGTIDHTEAHQALGQSSRTGVR